MGKEIKAVMLAMMMAVSACAPIRPAVVNSDAPLAQPPRPVQNQEPTNGIEEREDDLGLALINAYVDSAFKVITQVDDEPPALVMNWARPGMNGKLVLKHAAHMPKKRLIVRVRVMSLGTAYDYSRTFFPADMKDIKGIAVQFEYDTAFAKFRCLIADVDRPVPHAWPEYRRP